jgi:hypothetical protein
VANPWFVDATDEQRPPSQLVSQALDTWSDVGATSYRRLSVRLCLRAGPPAQRGRVNASTLPRCSSGCVPESALGGSIARTLSAPAARMGGVGAGALTCPKLHLRRRLILAPCLRPSQLPDAEPNPAVVRDRRRLLPLPHLPRRLPHTTTLSPPRPGRGIDPELAKAVAYFESRGNPEARGAAGEVGLFQVIPRDMAGRFAWAASRPSAAEMSTPEAQVSAGLDILQSALQSAGGDTANALSIYNSGRPLAQAPDSTKQVYVPGVMGIYRSSQQAQPAAAQAQEGTFAPPSPRVPQTIRPYELGTTAPPGGPPARWAPISTSRWRTYAATQHRPR